MHLEALKHREKYYSWFSRLTDIEKDMRDNFAGNKPLSNAETMYLVVKLIEP